MLILEVTLAALILSRGGWVKVGILGAILFLVGISPLGFEEAESAPGCGPGLSPDSRLPA